jgi:hypothetical protein
VAEARIRLERRLKIAQDLGPHEDHPPVLGTRCPLRSCFDSRASEAGLALATASPRSRSDQAIVELTLRQQIAAYAVKKPKPGLTPLDRAFWVAMFRFWPQWRSTLVIVKPSTVIGWHRKGFRIYWRWISRRPPGRPRTSEDLQNLIKRFAIENGWVNERSTRNFRSSNST